MKYTEAQKNFILTNAGKLSRKEMQKRMNITGNVFSGWCIELLGRKNKPPTQRETLEQKEGIFYHDENISTI